MIATPQAQRATGEDVNAKDIRLLKRILALEIGAYDVHDKKARHESNPGHAQVYMECMRSHHFRMSLLNSELSTVGVAPTKITLDVPLYQFAIDAERVLHDMYREYGLINHSYNVVLLVNTRLRPEQDRTDSLLKGIL